MSLFAIQTPGGNAREPRAQRESERESSESTSCFFPSLSLPPNTARLLSSGSSGEQSSSQGILPNTTRPPPNSPRPLYPPSRNAEVKEGRHLYLRRRASLAPSMSTSSPQSASCPVWNHSRLIGTDGLTRDVLYTSTYVCVCLCVSVCCKTFSFKTDE